MPSESTVARAAPARRSHRSTLLIAFAAQCALLLLTVFVMVSEDQPADPPVFEGEHVVSAASSERQRSDKMRQLQRRMSRPKTFQRLAVESSFESDLPPAPALPVAAFDPSASDAALFEDAQSMLADSGLMQLAGGLGGQDSAAEFFGVKDSGSRIVIIVNTSASVVRKAASRGVSIEAIQEEAARLIGSLGSGSSFGIVQFSQGVRSFASQLAPALAKNKRQAGEWAREALKGNPPIEDERYLGHEAAFRAAMLLQPDLIFVVTDGSLNRRERRSGGGYAYPTIPFAQLSAFIETEMRANGAKPRIHFIGFELGKGEREGLANLARRFNGSLREF